MSAHRSTPVNRNELGELLLLILSGHCHYILLKGNSMFFCDVFRGSFEILEID